ncbi:hypothetical protein [Streptomyces katsurahamanus]|uniref:Tetratricopeptide repeat protein n=1 Tax=Streptomyces katsurahamanus TaxID=2577098 RepID=A0ABW9NRN2_9ACTN|nr:hypothetical protein [Streptomyces katsurahamanus]MQS35819.1 hypothetical protein [Streptomyces katsurahamanus]
MDPVSNSISGGRFDTVIQSGQATVTQHFHAAARTPRVPRMRPAAPEVFVDRVPVCAELDELGSGLAGRKSPLIAVISGPPGVGKTGLSLHWAARREAEFPGGLFYADLSPRGSLVPSAPEGALQAFIGALGTPRAEMPPETADLAAHFRSLTAAAPCLILLDGVVNPAQVTPLLPGHPASMVVVTSRQRLSGLRALAPSRPAYFPLKGLDDDASTTLFLDAAESTGAEDRELLRTVIPALAGLPLAVRMAAARAADPLGGGVPELARRLTTRESFLETLAVSDDHAVRPVFSAFYAGLDETAARGFRALGAHPTPDFPDSLVETLAGAGAMGARVRRTLLEGHLLEPSAQGRCRMNRLVHEYARELAREQPDDAAVETLIRWYLRRAAATALLVSQAWRYGPLFAAPELLEGEFEDVTQALDAMEADRENAAAVVSIGYDTRRYDLTCQLVEALRGFFFRRKFHALWIEVCERGVAAAGHLHDDLVSARMHFELAFARYDRGTGDDIAAAGRQYGLSLQAARRARHARTESSALEGLGQVATRQGRPLDALDLFGRAQRALEGIGHPRGVALLEYHRGGAASAAKRHEEAAALLLSAKDRFAGLPTPDRYNVAKCLTRYAQARLAADRADEALPAIDEALELFTGLDAPKEHADAFVVRGDAHAADGRTDQARSDWTSALGNYARLGSVRAEEIGHRLAGPAHEQEGHPGAS